MRETLNDYTEVLKEVSAVSKNQPLYAARNDGGAYAVAEVDELDRRKALHNLFGRTQNSNISAVTRSMTRRQRRRKEQRILMKVLWLCNIMLPAIAQELGLPYSSREGWLSGIFGRMQKEKPAFPGETAETGGEALELAVCFPVEEMPAQLSASGGRLNLKGTVCYAFTEKLSSPENYDGRLEEAFRAILEDFRPDLVHIFGTEFPHTLAMTRAFRRPERTLVGIQGLCFACAQVYMEGLPRYVRERATFRDRIKGDSLKRQQEKFFLRGEREREALQEIGHITGRTEFDRRETEKINPSARYHFMNETMRAPFYSGSWSEKSCEPHTIFLSQGDYPLKGFHFALQAMPEILSEYPDARMYVAGNNITASDTWREKIKISSYGKYIRELIKERRLEGKVFMTGMLSAEQMKERLLKSSVYLCPSVLENSPNSLGEAMLLGVPAAAADTGGIPSLMADGKEGLLYQPSDIHGLAGAVLRIWRDPEGAKRRAQAARERARRVHDPEENYRRLIEIYMAVCF